MCIKSPIIRSDTILQVPRRQARLPRDQNPVPLDLDDLHPRFGGQRGVVGALADRPGGHQDTGLGLRVRSQLQGVGARGGPGVGVGPSVASCVDGRWGRGGGSNDVVGPSDWNGRVFELIFKIIYIMFICFNKTESLIAYN